MKYLNLVYFIPNEFLHYFLSRPSHIFCATTPSLCDRPCAANYLILLVFRSIKAISAIGNLVEGRLSVVLHLDVTSIGEVITPEVVHGDCRHGP